MADSPAPDIVERLKTTPLASVNAPLLLEAASEIASLHARIASVEAVIGEEMTQKQLARIGSDAGWGWNEACNRVRAALKGEEGC